MDMDSFWIGAYVATCVILILAGVVISLARMCG